MEKLVTVLTQVNFILTNFWFEAFEVLDVYLNAILSEGSLLNVFCGPINI